MATIDNTYSPSINIKRDRRKSLPYIATPNSKEVAASIIGSIESRRKSHVIVGAYGSGKSIFLWALAKTLGGNRDYFEKPKSVGPYHVVNIVGEFSSLREHFAKVFDADRIDDETILGAVQAECDYQIEDKKKQGLLIVVDEFGKFLEYAAKNNPEEEIYFLQRLAEEINDEESEIILVCSLHQNFNAYGYTLNKHQQNEWSKVQGRFNELTFNEPVEQLLFLASENLERLEERKPKGFRKLFQSIKISKTFPLRDYLTEDIALKLFPLDILSAGVLTVALQRYGQNERSLFSFLESAEQLWDLRNRKSRYYSLSDVYDYLKHSFSIINSKYNPHYVQWGSMASSIERAEGIFDDDLADAESLIKAIGLLNAFGSGAMTLDDDFLGIYGKYALGIKDPKKILEMLSDKRIIRYTNYNRRYVLFDGSDLDINLAIDEAGNLVEQVHDIITPLREYFDFQVVLAKSAYYKIGTPRFFEFVLTEDPISQHPSGEIDGYINLVFNEQLTVEELIALANKQKKPILYGLYKNIEELRRLIFEIRKIEKVIENNYEDRVATRELKNILEHQKKLLNHYILNTINYNVDFVEWIDFDGSHKLESEREFNQRLSKIVSYVYNKTPVYHSELINKTRLSSAIRTANKNFIRHLIEESNKSDWGFSEHLFPPEKTIYLSLVVDKGFQSISDGTKGFQSPTDKSFQYTWDKTSDFINASKQGKRSIRELVDELMRPPIKIKEGFLQFWLPLALYIKRNDFALYEGEAYIPSISPETFNLIIRHPHKYYVKAFQVQGIDLVLFTKYRQLLNQEESLPTNEAFIETVKPFLSFYRGLNTFSRSTKRISPVARRVRDAIAKSKDPEALFFKELPAALNTTKKELATDAKKATKYISDLQVAIKEIRTSYEELVQRFLSFISECTGHIDFRYSLSNRYKDLRLALLSEKQQVFYHRLTSDLDDTSFASSLTHSLIGKNLDRINDEDEPKIYHSFEGMINELDNLLDINAKAVEGNAEDFVLIDIQSTQTGRLRRVLPLSKVKRKKIQANKKEVLSVLTEDKQTSIAVLAELLNEMLNE